MSITNLKVSNVFVRHRSDIDWEKDSLKYVMVDNDVDKLNEILSELVNENPNYCNFINNISVCFINHLTRKMQYLKPVLVDVLELSISDNLNNDNRIVKKLVNNTLDIVTFTEFGMNELQTIFKNMTEVDSTLNNRGNSLLRTEYGFMHDGDNRKFNEFCFNINPEFNHIPKKSNLTFDHIRKLILSTRSEINSVQELVFIGPINILAAVIFFNGTLIIRWSTFKSYLEEFGKDITKTFLKSLLDRFIYYLSKEYSNNIGNMQQFIENRIFDKLEKYNYHSFDADTTQEGELNPTSKRHYKEYSTIIKKTIREEFNRESNILHFSPTMYDNLLLKVFERIIDQIKQHKNTSFQDGLRCGKLFEKLGWEFVDDTSQVPGYYNDTNNVQLWWKKEVNISPDRFCHGGKIYQLSDDKKNLITIRSIYVCSNGSVHVDQKFDKSKISYGHPNVGHASNVCLGDLKLRSQILNTSTEDFEHFLNNVSTFLQMMNFDSPFNGSCRPFFEEGCVPMLQKEKLQKTDVSVTPTFKKIRPVEEQEPENFNLKTDVLQTSVVKPQKIGNTVDYTSQDITQCSEVLRTVERTRDIHTGSINFETAAVWLHPNGISLIYLCTNRYNDPIPVYQKNKYSNVYDLYREEFNIVIKICRLIKVGSLLTIYKYVLNSGNVTKFIKNLQDERYITIDMKNMITSIASNILAKETKASQKGKNSQSNESIVENIPNPVMVDLSQFFDKMDLTHKIIVK